MLPQGDVLEPFLYIVIYYVSEGSVEDFGYLTHKGNTQDNIGRTATSNSRESDYKLPNMCRQHRTTRK